MAPDQPEYSANWLPLWSQRKFPVLVGGERSVAESSVIIEHLQPAHPGQRRSLRRGLTVPVSALRLCTNTLELTATDRAGLVHKHSVSFTVVAN